jgi:enoyl-CoA hydratase/carnithine racemase
MSVEVRVERGIPLVLLDRPQRRNALDLVTVEALREAVGRGHPVLVIGSTSPEAFSAGADLAVGDSERATISEGLYQLYREMRAADTIILAAADGHAVGGGAQLLIASDIRIGGPRLSVRFLGPGHGLVVGAWGLPALIGRGRAIELCLTMRTVEAEEALRIGLVERIGADPLEEAVELGLLIAELEPRAVAGVKRLVAMSEGAAALEAEQRFNSGWSGSIPGRSQP